MLHTRGTVHKVEHDLIGEFCFVREPDVPDTRLPDRGEQDLTVDFAEAEAFQERKPCKDIGLQDKGQVPDEPEGELC